MKRSEERPTALAGWRRLFSDSNGSMTIPSLFFFVVLVAFGGLSIDIQRVYGLQGQMQAYVDNVALSSAAELDGLTTDGGAIARALRAATGQGGAGPLVTGSQNFATTPALAVQKVTFLSSLDTDPGPRGTTPTTKEASSYVLCTWESGGWTTGAGCDANLTKIRTANFVEIVAVPRNVNYMVLPFADAITQLFGAGPIISSATVSVRATAGYLVEVCNNIPLMFCNPNEAPSLGGPGAPFVAVPGQMYYAGVQSGALYPGDFGLIQAIGGGKGTASAAEIRQAFARFNPNTFCYSSVTRKPGIATGPVAQGMNVRFDIYDATFGGGEKSQAEYRPAPNVVKGMIPNGSCNFQINNSNDQSKESIPLPRDNCFMAKAPGGAGSGCINVDQGKGPLPKMGDGKWARSEYWTLNHGPIGGAPLGYIDNANPVGGFTRYQTYRWEINNNALVTMPDEKGAPACYTGTVPPSIDPQFDRRVVTAAVVNCVADAGRLNGTTGVPAKIYAKLFLTEPANTETWLDGSTDKNHNYDERPTGLQWKEPPGNNHDAIWVEMIGLVPPNDEVLHVYPVLYR